MESFVAGFHGATGAIGKRMSEGLTAANDAIRNELERKPDDEGMGTTLIAAAVTPAGLEWVSVGDSPLYLLRGKVLKRLNADHSLRPVLREMSQRRELRAAESNPPSSGNLLRAALTGDEIAERLGHRIPEKFEYAERLRARAWQAPSARALPPPACPASCTASRRARAA